jgi:LCP family protein required for cell wall assembly
VAVLAGIGHGDRPGCKDGPVPDLPRHPRRRLALVIVIAELVVAVTTALVVGLTYRHLDSNLATLPEIPHVVAPPEPEPDEVRTALNVLVMGSDSRAGANAIDHEASDSERSDVTILLHVSADRETAYGVSIPRDTMVERPDCDVDGETVAGADAAIWNEAFMVGGPLCTVRQVEHVTGVYVDHTVVVDFNGFKEMVDAVDGVEVCIPRDVHDPGHGITLEAGRRLVTGDEALDYVRERTVLSANADLGRMRRQQAFVASMVGRVLSAGTLASPTRLYGFLDAATASVTLDRELGGLGDLVDLAAQFRATDPARIRFVTAPVEPYPADINRLQLAHEADRMWRLIREDRPLGELGRLAIGADDPVGAPDGGDGSEAARDREANGLCA